MKTLQQVGGAQQKNRPPTLGESFMRGRFFTQINIAPEALTERFSHSEDPKRTSASNSYKVILPVGDEDLGEN